MDNILSASWITLYCYPRQFLEEPPCRRRDLFFDRWIDVRFSECPVAWDNYNTRSTNIYARACFTGRLSSFHGPRPRLVSPRSGGSSSSNSNSSRRRRRRRRMKVERPRRRKRGVNPHERYHRNGTARVVMQSLLVGDQPLRYRLEGLDPSSLSTRLSRPHGPIRAPTYARLRSLPPSILHIFSRLFLNSSISRFISEYEISLI